MDKSWLNDAVEIGFGWFFRREYRLELFDGLSDQAQLDYALDNSLDVFKHDRTTTVARLDNSGSPLVLKRYNPRSALHAVSRALRQTRARRCWRMSYAFARAGLNVARPILMYERRFGPIRLNAYFASDLLEGEELLSALPTMTKPDQVLVAKLMNEAFQKMHVAKITHGDMKASNIIWSNKALYFIDLDAALKHRNRVTWAANHEKDKKRFLKNWHDQPELLALFDELD